MSRSALLVLLGVLTALLPFLGLPSVFVRGLLLLVGLAVLAIGVALRREGVRVAEDRASLPPATAEQHGPSAVA